MDVLYCRMMKWLWIGNRFIAYSYNSLRHLTNQMYDALGFLNMSRQWALSNRCLVAAFSCGRWSYSEFPNCSRPQLPTSNSNISQRLNWAFWLVNSRFEVTGWRLVSMSRYGTPLWALRPYITSCRIVAVWNWRSFFFFPWNSESQSYFTTDGQSVLVSGTPLGPMTRFYFSLWFCRKFALLFVVVRPLWR
jgi:hypothetical protein